MPTAYVWNNVCGWGREDAAYRLANAGFDVVLCDATNLYFDLACEKDPLERGYYWAGFVDTRAPFEFVPLDFFKNACQTPMGQPLREDTFADRVRLTPEGKSHILGLQGELWSENIRSEENLDYTAFPRLIALAERAWSKSPKWASVDDSKMRMREMERDWNEFANRLGQRELPRLDYLDGGIGYRLPPPGAIVKDGLLQANTELPGLEIRYTTDGSRLNRCRHFIASPSRSPVPLISGLSIRKAAAAALYLGYPRIESGFLDECATRVLQYIHLRRRYRRTLKSCSIDFQTGLHRVPA